MMVHIRHLGTQDYETVWEQMKCFTAQRNEHTQDELWLVEHTSVYTQGQAGKPEHILNRNAIPVVQADRGGQVTYHGPGQLVAYVLLDIRRRHLGVRTLVSQLEQLLILVLAHYGITAQTRCGAPGVYVQDQKIASIGLRVKNGCTYHGIALNVAMDLSPFLDINPCGYKELTMTQIQAFHSEVRIEKVKEQFVKHFLTLFEH